jgi:hypothetical protein
VAESGLAEQHSQGVRVQEVVVLLANKSTKVQGFYCMR